ncbi:Chthon cassette protein D [compost metagenome]
MRRPVKSTGFTLIELMVTIAVLAIIVSIAAPAMGDFIVRQRVSSRASELLSTLALARMEAIKLNSKVVVLPVGNGSDGWNSGWCVGPGNIANCQDSNVSRRFEAQSSATISSDYLLSSNKLTFRRDGTLASGLSARPFKISSPQLKANGTDARCIDLNAVGRATIREIGRDASC